MINWQLEVQRATVAELILLRSLIDRRVNSRRTAVCSCCGENKSVDCFSAHRGKRNGLQSQCKDCRNGYRRRKYRGLRQGSPLQSPLFDGM